MKNPDARAAAQYAIIQKQLPYVLTHLDEWRQEELNKLPYAKENTALAQGRCQVLKELVEFIHNAPKLVADPSWQQRQTHTDRSVTNGTS